MRSVTDKSLEYLTFFPHRYDFLWAAYHDPNKPPKWRTNSTNPLGDRQIIAANYLYGVRFGTETAYALLDIDLGSPYHPSREPRAIEHILACLEVAGICAHVAITSSFSGGIHIYLPFSEAYPTWIIGAGLKFLLQSSGYYVGAGILEIFPNDKNSGEKEKSLYNGHRLPLQVGSFMLDSNFQRGHTSDTSFSAAWKWARSRNSIDLAVLQDAIDRSRPRKRKMTYPAQKFYEDLCTEIDSGWTGSGQTNDLLGRIAMRHYIFNHVVEGGDPLQGEPLTQKIVEVAQNLPGFYEFCGHQSDIWERADHWRRCVEKSRYWPYGGSKPPAVEESPITKSWNYFQRQNARERIQLGIAHALNQGVWPAGATARFDYLVDHCSVSGETLYHHRDLWHPSCIGAFCSPELQNEVFPHGHCFEGASPVGNWRKLIALLGCNSLIDKGFADPLSPLSSEIGCNSLPGEESNDFSPPDRRDRWDDP